MPTKKTRPAPEKESLVQSASPPASRATKRSASDASEITAPASIRDWVAAAERKAREEPLKCAGIALAVGVVGSILPLGRVLGSLVRPVLIIAGLVKVLEEVERRRNP